MAKQRTRSKKQPLAAVRQPKAPGRLGVFLRGAVKHRLKLLGAVFLVGAICAGIVYGPQLISRLTKTANYQLKAIEVRGHRLINGEEILAASGLDDSTNIFSVDLYQTAQSIERLAWIKKAHIERKPPDRLVVDVVERRRLAWIELDQVYGVDQDGVLLPADKDPDEVTRDLDLPVITGLGIATQIPPVGQAMGDTALVQALAWWSEANSSEPNFCATISEIRLDRPGHIHLFLIGDGLEVQLPANRVAERLALLKNIVSRVYRECPNPVYIDMRFDGQVVVGSATAERRS